MRRLKLVCAVIAVALGMSAAHAAPCDLPAPGSTQPLAIGATGRSTLVHMPRRSGRGPLPLVILLHGSGGTGAGMLADSRLAATSDRHGFLLVAPNAGIPHEQGFVWNIPGVPTVSGRIPGPGDPDDVRYLQAMIDWLVADRCVDRTRVYATGLSGGGRMTSWLGCVASDRFAAIAPVVGLRAGNPAAGTRAPDRRTCNPPRPVPVIAFAGGRDTTNPVAGGGAPYWQYSMRAAEARWGDINGCRRPLPERTLPGGIVEQGYTGCRAGAEVIARIDPPAGHSWVADNEAMWAFFARHRRR